MAFHIPRTLGLSGEYALKIAESSKSRSIFLNSKFQKESGVSQLVKDVCAVSK